MTIESIKQRNQTSNPVPTPPHHEHSRFQAPEPGPLLPNREIDRNPAQAQETQNQYRMAGLLGERKACSGKRSTREPLSNSREICDLCEATDQTLAFFVSSDVQSTRQAIKTSSSGRLSGSPQRWRRTGRSFTRQSSKRFNCYR
jgi:hypothetical protein